MASGPQQVGPQHDPAESPARLTSDAMAPYLSPDDPPQILGCAHGVHPTPPAYRG